VIVLSHRGYWKEPAEKNRPEAFERSFDLGFGTETDVRDLRGELMIAHDMPTGAEVTLVQFLAILNRRDLPLAMNIKADGLARSLDAQMRAHGLTQWFTFDMSVPEMVVQLGLGLPVFTRASEYEQPPACYDRAVGVWLDAFRSEWYAARDVEAFLRDGKRVCIVSPELHRRPHQGLWAMLRDAGLDRHDGLMLCSDVPEDAVRYFGGTA
jgi:hypothetical protein